MSNRDKRQLVQRRAPRACSARLDVLHVEKEYWVRDKILGRILARCDHPHDAYLIAGTLNRVTGPNATCERCANSAYARPDCLTGGHNAD
jgi:hypothetical protein